MRTQRTRKVGAFTLLELLVATAITAVLMTLMVAIITSISKNWNTTSGKLTSEGEARLVLDQITQDLQSAIYRSDGNVWMAATILPDTTGWSTAQGSNIKPASGSIDFAATGSTVPASQKGQIAYARFGISGVCLQFFTNQPGTNTAGDTSTLSAPVAVCYRLMRQQITANPNSAAGYMLYRGSVTPQATFTAGYNLRGGTSYTAAASDGTQYAALPAIPGQMLAQNIVDFGIRMYVKETQPSTSPYANTTNYRLIFPAVAVGTQYNAGNGYQYPMGTLYAGAPGDQQTIHYCTSNTALASNPSDYYSTVFPTRVDVMIRVLTQTGVQQLALFEQGKITGDWWTIVLANSVVYTRSIEINAQPF